MSKSLFINAISCALLACLNSASAFASTNTEVTPANGNAAQPAMNVSSSATKLLYRGRFGPTPETLQSAQEVTRQQWITAQMQLAPNWHYPLTAKDKLHQRVAFALSQIFVVSSQEPVLAKYSDGLAWYYDLFVKHSFGNYRDLLQDITLSPAMGTYLSMQGNRKANLNENTFPDENYAREVIQLFSIGLYQLDIRGDVVLDKQGNKIPSYQQADVENLARIFTGWDLVENKRYGHRRSGRYDTFMELSPKQHDYNEKVLFGQHITAGMKADKELSVSLDMLFHHPNVGPFISRQLILHLVASNPSPDYIKRIATVFNDNGKGIRGDLSAVVHAILLDDDAKV